MKPSVARKWICPGLSLPFAAAALLAAAPGAALAAERMHSEAAAETIVAGPTAEEHAAKQRQLADALLRELPAAALDAPVRVRLTAEDRRELEVPTRPLRIGAVKALAPAIRFAGLDARDLSRAGGRFNGGFLQATPDGGFLWALPVLAEDAGGVRVRFTDFNLPGNADLYFVSRSGEAYGPYQRRGPDGSGDFWSHTVLAAEGIVMLRHFGPASAEEMRGLSFGIGEVGHILPRFTAGLLPSAFCGNEACVVDATCFNVSAVSSAKNAVAYMEWVQGAWIYSCSGGLIADTDASTTIPYFLTANHCMSSNNAAGNLEAFFFYRTSSCNGVCPNYTTFPRTLGASVMATGKSGDFSLLRLSQTPPSGATLLGWNNAPVANNADIYRVSHPLGAPQAFTHQRVDTGAGVCGGLPMGAFIYSRDIEGATDGGSSGSPVVNASGQIVGQLYGGCGTNINEVCDAVNNATVDGALAHYYPNVAAFLDPAGGCTPVAEVCNDGADNDCDGATDCADSNCSGAPNCGGTCGAQGTSCTAGSQCCSNKCTGPAGNKSCR